jgi:hypothetical protein
MVTAAPTLTPTPGPTGTPTVTATPTLTTTPGPTQALIPITTPDNDGDDDDDDDDDDQDGAGNNSSLSGAVWYDLNADGIPDPGEPGIPGISVRLIGQRTMLDSAVTGPDGSYRFATIPAGGYSGAEFLMPDGYSCTLPGLGSDASPLDEEVAFAEGGADRQTLNAGFVGSYLPEAPAASYGWILGTTWSDDNGDGVRDETTGMTDVEVTLLDAGGDAVESARTGYHDSYTSLYLFGPLLPGEYSVAFTPPDGYIFTGTGGDSSADPLTGITAPFAVGGGDTVVKDAGLIPAPAPTLTASPGETGGTENESPGGEETGGAENTTDDGPLVPVVTPGPENGTAGDGENTRDAPAATPDGDLPSDG